VEESHADYLLHERACCIAGLSEARWGGGGGTPVMTILYLSSVSCTAAITIRYNLSVTVRCYIDIVCISRVTKPIRSCLWG
jgi:hypothetical protein